MKKYLLEIIVFTTGAGIMIFELVASRVLAPFVGTTLMVWSSLIGVILAAMSLGYWYGGRLADKNAEFFHFSLLIFWAAVCVALAGLFKIPLINFLDKHIDDFRWEAIWASLILFAPGSFFMAAVSPYAARLRLVNLKQTGSTVGNLYAVSTVGSIFGAFITGLVLVSYLGNTKIIFLLAGLLFFASLLAFSQRGLKAKAFGAAAVVLLLLFSSKIDLFYLPKDVTLVRSRYLDIMVAKAVDNFSNINTNSGSGRPILKLFTGSATIQSAMFLDNPNEMVFPYIKFFSALAKYFNPGLNNALVIGGAAYSYPKQFLQDYPKGHVDVVEIDPQMTEVAQQYFHLPKDSRLTTYNLDGRVFLNKTQKKYDAIFMDSFRTFVPPYQLTTLETAQNIYRSLNDNGTVFVNMVSAVEGDKGKFFRAEYATYAKVFPKLYVFRIQVPLLDISQNLILVASKSSLPVSLNSSNQEANSYLQHAYQGPVAMDIPILTDDHAPVADYMLQTSKDIK